ncbi:hypothetical protein FE275_14060 [Pseudomonas koreensis]|nr:hypothetical protein FE275_14060 [Pseudomonas koreensis]
MRTPSRASPLPQGIVVNAKSVFTEDPCGSGLAREEARPDTGDSELGRRQFRRHPITDLERLANQLLLRRQIHRVL